MTRYLIPVLCLVFSSFLTLAQNKTTRLADQAYEDQQYLLAIQKYEKAFSKVKVKSEKERIALRIADCYRLTNNTKKAEMAYKRLITSKAFNQHPKVLLYYADALRANADTARPEEKYKEAIKQYQAYAEKVPNDPRALDGIRSCELALEWLKSPSKHKISNLKKINTRESEFAPSYADKNYNSIIFTSSRESASGKEKDNWTGEDFSDLFLAKKDRKGDWATPAPADEEEILNTGANEGSPMFNSRFNILYFTRCPNESKTKSGCQIYKTTRAGTYTWSEAEMIPLSLDSTAPIGHPSVNADETILFFSADLPGGQGGKDIWMAKRKSKNEEFSHPVNVGEEINTTGDELFPFIRNDSMLYFASNGHPGVGGLDIFVSIKRDNKWGKPENLKWPISSPGDDFGIIFNPEAKEEGYFSSNRKGGRGKDDIYSFVVPPVFYSLAGTVKDDNTLQFIQGAKVQMVGSNGRTIDDLTDANGYYSYNKNQVLPNTTYELLVTAKDYFNEKKKTTTVGLERSTDLVLDFRLKPIPKKPVVLPEIRYDLAKWDLKPQYQDSLQGLIGILDANENLVIELASHTDARDSDERNDILSQKRAQSVVDYLILRGIDPDRLVAKGYGERVPRTLLKDITIDGIRFKAGTRLTESFIDSLKDVRSKEAAHQLNRRSEFSILRNDFIPKNKPVKPETAKIDIVTNPDEEAFVRISTNKDGSIEGECFVNGIAMGFTYNAADKGVTIAPAEALKLLKNGAITKEDFKGDAEKILANATITDRAVFTVKAIRIGKEIIEDIEFVVNYKSKYPLLFGGDILKQFGSFTIDKDNNRLILK